MNIIDVVTFFPFLVLAYAFGVCRVHEFITFRPFKKGDESIITVHKRRSKKRRKKAIIKKPIIKKPIVKPGRSFLNTPIEREDAQ